MSRGTGRIDEVQGLRGIAVAAVVLFHAKIPGLHGGFLGVDVFFVISGFVISLMLRRDLAAGTFSFADFYLRRAWRLMPALAVTLVGSGLLFGLLVPAALDGNLWQSLVAAALGLSNFYFNGRLDYFDGGILNPALHTWSLGVEEQFYFVFPLLLVFLHRPRWRRSMPWVFPALALLGFAAATFQTSWSQPEAFYLPWFRAWEFMAGAVMAFTCWNSDRGTSTWRQAAWASWLGMLLLGASLLFYRERYVFPGVGALAPVLGTMLLIAGAGRGGLVNRVLASRPLTWAGDASYSIYLAHWPVTCAIGMFVPLQRLHFALLALVASVLAGVVLWRCVEVPLRRGFHGRFAKMPVWLVPLTMASVALLSLSAVSLGDAVWRRNPQAMALFENGRPTSDVFRRERCFLTLKSTIQNFDRAECIPRRPDAPALLVLGDSMAANIVQELKARMPDVDVQQATAVDYKPGLPGPKRPLATAELDGWVHRYLLAGGNQKPHVLIYARWEADDLKPLTALVEDLRGKGYRVTVMGPSPQFYMALPFLAGYGEMLGSDLVPLMTKTEGMDLDRMFGATLPSGSYVSVVNILCKTKPDAEARRENCITRIGNDLMFFDNLHYTPVGARFLVQHLPFAG